MPMEHKFLAPSLRQFLESNPSLFMRCDAVGNENPNGEFWRVREDVEELKIKAKMRDSAADTGHIMAARKR